MNAAAMKRLRSRWLVGVVLLVVLGTAMGGMMENHAERALQWYVSRYHPELEVVVGSVRIDSLSELRFEDLLVRSRESPESKIWVERAWITADWQGLAVPRLESVRLENPAVRIDDALLAAFSGGGGSGVDGGGDAEGDGVDGGFTLPRLEVEGGQVEVALGMLPAVGFRLEASTRDGVIELKLEDVRAGSGQGGAGIDEVVLAVGRDLLLSRRIHRLAVLDPDVVITPGAIEEWRGRKDGGGSVEVDGTEGSGAAVADVRAPRGAGLAAGWRVDKLDIRAGVHVCGFSAHVPELRFRVDAQVDTLGLSDSLAQLVHRVELSDMVLAAPFDPERPFLEMSRAEVAFTLGELLEKRIASVDVEKSAFVLSRSFRSLLQAGGEAGESAGVGVADPAAGAGGGSADGGGALWRIGEFTLAESGVVLADLGRGIPDIAFTVNDTALSEVALTGDAEQADDSMKKIELTDFVIHSPYDPFQPVVALRSIFATFSLAGLLRRQIEDLTILHPTIYISRDLFWYADVAGGGEVGGASGGGDGDEPMDGGAALPDWEIRRFKAAYGVLALAVTGTQDVALPIHFETEARNVAFRNFNDLTLKLDIDIPTEDFRFPSYQLELMQLGGDMEFGLPPDSGSNNLVNTLRADRVLWRQYEGDAAWISVTYDRRGIYGDFGMEAYEGYLDGGFSFFFRDGHPWTGWASGSGIGLDPFTAVLAPSVFRMDGPADFQIEVNAQSSRIERVVGNVSVLETGTLNIPRLDELADKLPGDWTSLKRDISRIGIGALSSFRYDGGEAEFWFIDKHGRLNLSLTGPRGSRNFDIVVHDTPFKAPRLWEKDLDIAGDIEIGREP